jgi:hypothetical protein
VRARSLLAAVLIAALVLVAGLASAPGALADYPPPSMQITSKTGAAKLGPEGITVSWSTGDGTGGALFRSVDGGPFKQINAGFSSFQQEIFDTPYTVPQRFQVRQLGDTPKVLIDAVIEGGKPRIVSIARPIPPHSVPTWFPDFMRLVIVEVFALFGVLTAAYLWSLRGLRHVA